MWLLRQVRSRVAVLSQQPTGRRVRTVSGPNPGRPSRLSGYAHLGNSIERITQVIGDVGEIVTSIASAIEEQSTVTRDVATNIAQATHGVRDANERIAHTASASHSIAKDIAAVTSTVTELVAGSENLRGSSTDLNDLAQIAERVGKFQV